MAATSTRKVFKIGDSRAISIPPDAKHYHEKHVHLIYNDQVIVVLREDMGPMIHFPISEVIQDRISQALQKLADSMKPPEERASNDRKYTVSR